MSFPKSVFAFLVAGAILFSVPVAVHADDGATALLPFAGKNGAKVRQRVQTKLNKANQITVPLSKVSAAYRKTKSYSRLANRLGATVFVRGTVRRVKKGWRLNVEVRNKRGKRLRKFTVRSSRYTRVADRTALKLTKLGILPEKAAPAPEPIAWQAPSEETEPKAEDRDVSAAVATDSTTRVVVRPFKGKGGSKVRVGAVRALKRKSVVLVSNGLFVKKAKQLGVRLSKDDGHILPAGALKVNAIVEGEVLREGNRWTAYVRLVDARSLKVLDQQFYEARTSVALARAVQKTFWGRVGEEVKDLAPKPSSKSGESRRSRRARRKAQRNGIGLPAAFDMSINARLVRRTLKYNQDLRRDLRGYTLNAAPGMSLKVRWYPGAHFVSDWPAHFGLDVEYERLFDFQSMRADGLEFPSQSKSFGIGLRWRYPLKIFQPSVILGYGAHSFQVLIAGPPRPGVETTPLVPKVKYRFVRMGAELRMDISWFKVMVNAAYLFVFDTGGIQSDIWFPRNKADGMEAGLLLGFGLPAGFEIRGGVDYRRYFHDLRPDPNNNPPWVAGGALDEYWGFTLGLAWRN